MRTLLYKRVRGYDEWGYFGDVVVLKGWARALLLVGKALFVLVFGSLAFVLAFAFLAMLVG